MIISTLINSRTAAEMVSNEELCCSSVVTTRDPYLILPGDLLALVLPRRPTYFALKPDKLL